MNKNRLLLIFVATTLSCLMLHSKVNSATTDTMPASKGISIAYRTNFDELQTDLHIGALLGLERYYIQNEKYKVIGLVSLTVQRKPDIYTSAGLMLGHAIRRTYKPGMFLEHCINFGYLGSYYDFDMYKTNSDGDIINIGRTWMSSVILGYSLGLGYDFSKLTKANFQAFLKPAYYLRLPNNDNVFLFNNYCLEAGITVHPRWLEWSKGK